MSACAALQYPPSINSQRYFDPVIAMRYERFFPKLIKITEGDKAGEPLELAPEPWLTAIRECMGWRMVKDGRRWYRQLYIYIPRKNAKTTTIAGLVLAIPIIEPEARGQIVIVAATEDQAKILFKHASEFIAASPVLQEIYYSGEDVIEHVATGTTIKFMSGTSLGKVGLNPSVIIVDELQEQTKPDLLAKLITGTNTRKQPLAILIGTAGIEDDTQDVYWIRWRKKAEQCLKNPATNPRLLPIVYQTDEDADPGDPDVWMAANPTLGTVIDFDNFAALWEEMKDDPAERQFFCQYHLNMKRSAWSEAIDLRRWAELELKFNEKDLRNMLAFGGLDLGLTSDMCAFALLFPEWEKIKYLDENGKTKMAWHPKFKVLVWYWTCRAYALASEKKAFSYKPLVESGRIRIAGDKVIDYNQVGTEILQIIKQFRVKKIGYDQWSANEMVGRLAKFGRVEMVTVRQNSPTLAPATHRLKTMVENGDIHHDGNPMLTQNWRNARVLVDKGGNPYIGKTETNNKIDGVTAIQDAVRIFLDEPPKKVIEV